MFLSSYLHILVPTYSDWAYMHTVVSLNVVVCTVKIIPVFLYLKSTITGHFIQWNNQSGDASMKPQKTYARFKIRHCRLCSIKCIIVYILLTLTVHTSSIYSVFCKNCVKIGIINHLIFVTGKWRLLEDFSHGMTHPPLPLPPSPG